MPKPRATNKPKPSAPKLRLSEAVKRRCKELEKTQEEVAGELSVSVNTFRTWLGRNTVPRTHVEKLLAALDWKHIPPDELERKYAVDKITDGQQPPQTLYDVFLRYDGRFQSLRPMFDGLLQDLTESFRLMREGECLVFFSIQMEPIEFSELLWERFGQSMIEAAASGARFAYVVASDELAVRLNERYGAAVAPPFSERRRQYMAFLDRAKRYAAGKRHIDFAAVCERVLLLPTDDQRFGIPRMTLALHRALKWSAQPYDRMSVRLPTDVGHFILLPVEQESFQFTELYVSFVMDVIREVRGRPSPPKGLDGLAGCFGIT